MMALGSDVIILVSFGHAVYVHTVSVAQVCVAYHLSPETFRPDVVRGSFTHHLVGMRPCLMFAVCCLLHTALFISTTIDSRLHL